LRYAGRNPIYSYVLGTGSGTASVAISTSSLSGALVINTDRGNDHLTIDESIAGLGRQIVFNGGSGNDVLSVSGSGGNVRYTPDVFIGATQGVSSNGVESVDISGFNAVTVDLSSASLSVGYDGTSGTIPAVSAPRTAS
jgi:hypothetical protein